MTFYVYFCFVAYVLSNNGASTYSAMHSRIEADNVWGKGPQTSGEKNKNKNYAVISVLRCRDESREKHGTAGWNYVTTVFVLTCQRNLSTCWPDLFEFCTVVHRQVSTAEVSLLVNRAIR